MTTKGKFAAHTPKKFNNAELLGVFADGSDEWHAARDEGVGGSDIGTLLGTQPVFVCLLFVGSQDRANRKARGR
jgi:hypothetical protein